jgi:hypothetical protein
MNRLYGSAREFPAMPDYADKLRHCISRLERLLREGADPELARVYLAELTADRACLTAIERGLPYRLGTNQVYADAA